MARKRATLSDLLNDLTAKAIYNKYKMIALNTFEWGNLPDGIEERHIENFLYSDGKAVFFRDPEMGFFCLRADQGHDLNVYGDPLHWWATGLNYRRELRADECVIISNNKPRIATDDFIYLYTSKITECERTMDVNVKAIKTPYIITCDDKDVLTFKRLFQQIDGNVPAIYTDRNLNIDSIQVLKTGVVFYGNDLMDFKNSVENELLTFLGVNNVPTDKKERMITDEANSNNQLISSFMDIQLEARQRACDEINAMFGLNITVKPRQTVEKSVDSVEKEESNDVESSDV